jgi:hypothetical protein
MGRGYRSRFSKEAPLLPPSLRDWSSGNHLAHFVSDVLDQRDLRAIESVQGELVWLTAEQLTA